VARALVRSGVRLSAAELERELKELHGLARRLQPPLNERPHLFHEQKDAFVRAIGGLIERCGFTAPASPRIFRAAVGDDGARSVRVAGRDIPIQRRRR